MVNPHTVATLCKSHLGSGNFAIFCNPECNPHDSHIPSQEFSDSFLRKKTDGLQLDKPKQQKHGSIFSLWSVSWFKSRWLGIFGIPQNMKRKCFPWNKTPDFPSLTTGPQINPWLRSPQTNQFPATPWCWDTTSRWPSWFGCWNPAYVLEN